MNCSPAGSSVHGILQVGLLEWIAIPFSRGSSPPVMEPASFTPNQHWQAGSLPPVPGGASGLYRQRLLDRGLGTWTPLK